jgi:NADPH-dependent ferric siderophore reductase
MAEEKRKPPIIREVLRVVRKEQITPNYLRIILGGEEIQKFNMVTVGINNKIFIPPKGVDEIYFPTETAEIPDELRPIMRTYTCRNLDFEKNEMTIDFALHGDEGIASAWAKNCKIGDKIGVAMKGFAKQLYPEADWYLLAGDMTALPVLSLILETLPGSAKGTAIIEVQNIDDEQIIETKSQVEIKWIHNPTPGKTAQLQDAVRSVKLPSGEEIKKFAYVAAEFAAVRTIRQFLRQEKNWKANELHGFGYWQMGTPEENSAHERHEESHER